MAEFDIIGAVFRRRPAGAGEHHIAEIETLPWRTDELVLIVPPGYPLAHRIEINPNDLTKETFLNREQEELRKLGLQHLISRPLDLPGNPKISAGIQRYTAVKAPVLAICAGQSQKALQVSLEKEWKPIVERNAPSAKFVVLPDATHLIFISNEEDVLREMNAFIAGLHKLP